MKIKAIVVASLFLLSTGVAFADEYKEGSAGTGSISGTVTLKGAAPAPITANLKNEKNPEFCTNHPDTKDGVRTINKVKANGGKLQDTVVFIEEIATGKPWAKEPIQYEFKMCDVFPKISVVRRSPKGVNAGIVNIVNQDENILHNPHGYNVKGAQRITLFNKPMPTKGSNVDATSSLNRFKEGKDTAFFLQCDQHNFMEADARIVYNPYFAVSGADGAFKIDGIPAGKYKVTAWHPYVGEVTKDVEVGAADVKADFELAKK